MNVQANTTYTSNNPCFPGQLFHVLEVTDAERFGKPNKLIKYQRWAWPMGHQLPYLVETTTSWLNSADKCFLGVQLPSDLEQEFAQQREAVATVRDMMGM
jgi:hypothetical protein